MKTSKENSYNRRVKPMVRRFNREERANIAHALIHLEANKIANEGYCGGWCRGNKKQFIERHKRAIGFLQSLLDA